MAIMGFLVHTLEDACANVESSLGEMPEMSTYGIHENCYVVAVAEAPREEMESVLERVKEVDGVIACYVTSLTIEDELPESE